ncbi:MAG: hypothetical protein GQ546_09105 [Gammaproteobacteria bacterium]|nr:hypothetical protein [Gammaproteobacteria bacterium]
MVKISRNAPCPCGSGKKYKKCCLNKDVDERKSSNDFSSDFREALNDQEFNSLEEAQRMASAVSQARNNRPIEAFHDISPDQMRQLFYFTYESPDVVTFSEPKTDIDYVPLLKLVRMLVAGIGEKGVKATAKGNLPRNLCRDIALNYWGEKNYDEVTGYRKINSEMDFFDLHVASLVAKMAGLIRKYKGKYVRTKKCEQLLSDEKQGELYLLIFTIFTSKFNWGYWDGYEEMPIIQKSFAFSLYLLSRYGSDWKNHQVYCEYSLKAFPTVLEEIEEVPWETSENQYKNCFALRTFERFAIFLGLAKMDDSSQNKIMKKDYQIKKLPLLDEVLHFHLRTLH